MGSSKKTATWHSSIGISLKNDLINAKLCNGRRERIGRIGQESRKKKGVVVLSIVSIQFDTYVLYVSKTHFF